MSICNRLDLQTLGSQPMPKNLPDHWEAKNLKRLTLYMAWGRMGSQPAFFINFFPTSNLVSCVKLMRPTIRFQCSWGLEGLVRRVYLPWISGRDVHYPTDETDPTHVEGLSQGKPWSKEFALNFYRIGHKIRNWTQQIMENCSLERHWCLSNERKIHFHLWFRMNFSVLK